MSDKRNLLISYIKKCNEEGPYYVKDNVFKYDSKLQTRSDFFNLKNLLDDFINGRIENRFILMPGLRGVGKTTLLFQMYDYLLSKGIDNSQILYFSADDLNQLLGRNIRDAVEIFSNEFHGNELVSLNKELFIFIDETQEIEGWSKQGKIIFDKSKKIFMVFTGSTALDFELDVNAVRRTKKEVIFPLGFKEHLQLKYPQYSFDDISESLMDCVLTGNADAASKQEKSFYSSMPKLDYSLEKEWQHFLTRGGFPDSIYLEKSDSYGRIYDMVEHVVEKDVYHFLSYNNGTKAKIFQILTFMALQKPGSFSNANLSKNISLSVSRVNSILKVLEKTHLIFHLNPYGGAGKTVRKAWKYYFLAPSIGASINYRLGRYSDYDENYLGVLTENLVASTFFKMNFLYKRPYGIFHIPDKNHADFLLSKIDGTNVPVEVGHGQKSRKQVIKSMNKYDSEYGIIISKTTPFIKKEDDIIYMPLTTFSLII